MKDMKILKFCVFCSVLSLRSFRLLVSMRCILSVSANLTTGGQNQKIAASSAYSDFFRKVLLYLPLDYNNIYLKKST